MTVNTFVQKGRAPSANEPSNHALFFVDLTAVLGVPRPNPATGNPERDGYTYTIDRQFARARETEVADVLAALDALGLVQRSDEGRYSA